MLRYFVAFLVIIGAIYYAYSSKDREGIVVKTGSGQVKGIISKSRDGKEFYSWRGIPYAEPPIGTLRFATPKPVKEWQGVLDGSSYRAKCAQLAFILHTIIGEEDCLFLNVHVPKEQFDNNHKLPVMVHIHGGAFVAGSAEDIGPNYLMDENAIQVTLNYRLGMLGFLSLGDKNIRGNMGLKDQSLALNWIKANIHHFRGDSSRITIWGTSAGAASVHYQLLSNKTQGLFHRAISMSGTSFMPWSFSSSEKSISKTRNLAHQLNCPTNETNEQLTECLQNLSLKNLLAVYKKDFETMTLFYPSQFGDLLNPTVELVSDDESFLTEGPFDIVAYGKAHRIPHMLSICRDEGLLSAGEFYRIPEALENFEKNWDKCVQNCFSLDSLPDSESSESRGMNAAKRLKEFYLSGKNPQDFQREDRIQSQVAQVQRKYSPIFIYYYNKTGVPSMGYVLTELGERFHPIIELVILMGRFLWEKLCWWQPTKNHWISHADDIFMIIPAPFFGVERDHPEYEFSKDLVKLYVQFASGDLDSLEFRGTKFEQASEWGEIKYLSVSENPKMVSEPFADRTQFWQLLKYSRIFSIKK